MSSIDTDSFQYRFTLQDDAPLMEYFPAEQAVQLVVYVVSPWYEPAVQDYQAILQRYRVLRQGEW